MRKAPSAAVPTGEPVPLFYNTQEVATVLCVPFDTVDYWRKQGIMTGPLGVAVGKRVLYPRAAVHAFVEEMIATQAADWRERR